MQVDFYQLAAAAVEAILPRIAERVLENDERLLIVSEDDGLAERIDQALWTYAPDGFLPHARRGEGHDGMQPVLISPDCEPLNEARNIALADGVWRDEALRFERAFIFFAEDQVEEARAAWRRLGNAGDIVRKFWKQDENGRWTQAA